MIFNLTQNISGEVRIVDAHSASVPVRSRRPAQSSVKDSKPNPLDAWGRPESRTSYVHACILQQSPENLDVIWIAPMTWPRDADAVEAICSAAHCLHVVALGAFPLYPNWLH